MQLPAYLTDDFLHANPVYHQYVGDQRAMAAPRRGLGANQCDTLLLCQFDQSRQIFCKFPGLHVVYVTAKRIVSPTPIGRIVDANGFRRHGKSVAVKLRVVARARYARL